MSVLKLQYIRVLSVTAFTQKYFKNAHTVKYCIKSNSEFRHYEK